MGTAVTAATAGTTLAATAGCTASPLSSYGLLLLLGLLLLCLSGSLHFTLGKSLTNSYASGVDYGTKSPVACNTLHDVMGVEHNMLRLRSVRGSPVNDDIE
jgi:hypothetical protein